MTDNANHLRALITGAGLTRAEAAALLYVTPSAIANWFRPEGTAGHVQPPRWAVDLLALKTRQPVPPGGTEAPRRRARRAPRPRAGDAAEGAGEPASA